MRPVRRRRPAALQRRCNGGRSPGDDGWGVAHRHCGYPRRGGPMLRHRMPIMRPAPTTPADTAAGSPTVADPMPPRGHPFASEIDAERRGWYDLTALVRRLDPEECLVPGYYVDPDWTVRDLVAHVGTWLAQAEIELARINAGTYEGHDRRHRGAQRGVPRGHARPAMERRVGPGPQCADPDAPGVVRARYGERRGGLVDPQVGTGALRRAPRPPRGVGRRARRAPAGRTRTGVSRSRRAARRCGAAQPADQIVWFASRMWWRV